jgi:tRNA-specific adenosine deaminase 1
MKCLPMHKLTMACGNVLHDSHAEVVTIRAFNRFLLEQCLQLVKDPASTSPYIRRRSPEEITLSLPQPFDIRDGVSIHMYGSEAPCGDASMELIMAAQEDATPWELSSAASAQVIGLQGRGSFAELGIVRRKPARPDAPPTLSKSCTDKLTIYQYISTLNSITSLLVLPRNAYLATLTIPKSRYVEVAVIRAFTTLGRLPEMTLVREGGYSFHPFTVQTTGVEFAWSRRAVPLDDKPIPSNITAMYTVNGSETLINGVLQGRQVGDPKGASKISRRGLWQVAEAFAVFLCNDELRHTLRGYSYAYLKSSSLLTNRRLVKDHVKEFALTGWIRNQGDDDFNLG